MLLSKSAQAARSNQGKESRSIVLDPPPGGPRPLLVGFANQAEHGQLIMDLTASVYSVQCDRDSMKRVPGDVGRVHDPHQRRHSRLITHSISNRTLLSIVVCRLITLGFALMPPFNRFRILCRHDLAGDPAQKNALSANDHRSPSCSIRSTIHPRNPFVCPPSGQGLCSYASSPPCRVKALRPTSSRSTCFSAFFRTSAGKLRRTCSTSPRHCHKRPRNLSQRIAASSCPCASEVCFKVSMAFSSFSNVLTCATCASRIMLCSTRSSFANCSPTSLSSLVIAPPS